TVRWAEAAHNAGLDGLVWMSRQCNDTKAYVFFGDRCAEALAQDPSHARIFASPADQIWLIDRCAPLHVGVLMEPSYHPPVRAAGSTNRWVPNVVTDPTIQARFTMTATP